MSVTALPQPEPEPTPFDGLVGQIAGHILAALKAAFGDMTIGELAAAVGDMKVAVAIDAFLEGAAPKAS